MQIRSLSEAAPDRRPPAVNEDLVLTGPDFALVLDGATAPQGVDSGCQHDVPWLVKQLAIQLAPALLAQSAAPLPDQLAEAIAAVRAAHADTCDVSNPDSPSSTVSIVRLHPDHVEHLVLADSPVVMRSADGEITVHSDDRVEQLPERTLEAVRRLRNRPGGFWAASTDPQAAYEAITGRTDRADVDVIAILSDGASRFTECYGHTWDELIDVLTTAGPRELIDRVREYDATSTDRWKQYDDASVVLLQRP
ncbi:protein phosphatase 2C domain-containing protein [Kribbella sp.]|uniref:protein phosphatase 2C domain-containing protein n=1 Tax=Kribbella sp. TaxID=1871183 RepID=UPI002D3C6D53|nr:protein phosphatase 2C domain-containing protein [Kribbella sp.]HZX07539.1 protein phosphatase 2C domain-containing protein [Kribbella sp.]